MCKKLFLISLVLLLGLVGNCLADVVNVQNVTAASDSAQGAIHTVNSSGMTGDLHDSSYFTLWMTAVGADGGGDDNPHPGTYNPGPGHWTWIKFEFDDVYKLRELWVWNYNEWTVRGLKNVVIEYTSDGTTWETLGSHLFARAPTDGTGHGYDNYAHNTTIDFGGVEANAVIITTYEGVSVGNWGDGISLFGLSEVRFYCLDPNEATEPSPATGTEGLTVYTVLSWRAGAYAADVNGHDVYLGTDYNSVADANHSSDEFMGNWDSNSYDPCGLEFAQLYYWRVDEVNDTNIWPGEVWSFKIAPAEANNSSPADEATNVYTGAKLRWSTGGAATSHDVYFGTNFNDVNTAADPNILPGRGNQTATTYEPDPMDMNTTYYWRIDERNGPDRWPGEMWSFTTTDVELPLQIKRGVTIGRGGSTIPWPLSETFLPSDVRFIKSMGFDHIKLLFDPDPFKSGDGLNESNMRYLDESINLVTNEGLRVVVCIHAPLAFETMVLTDWQEFEDMLGFYEALGAYMAARWSPGQLAFQLMTEPDRNAWDWNVMQPLMWQAVRRGMPNHTLILTGDQSSIIEALVQVVPVDDGNIIYCFGFYEPFVFPLQGWPFDKRYLPYLAGVPYPSSPSIIAAVLDDIVAAVPSEWQAQAEADLITYGNEYWNRDKLASRIQMAMDWAENNGGQKLWITEWQVFHTTVNQDDRYEFIRDARELFEANGIGWAYWTYNGIHTILNNNRIPGGGHGPPDPDWIDERMLNALGMFAGEGDVNHDGIIDFLDFAELASGWLENRAWP